MFKGTVPKAVAALYLLTLVRYGCCESVDKDWSLGCYKQTTSNSCFNITAGDYDPLVNLTGKACVGACSALNISAKYAGLTANGVCLCSQLKEICLNQTANTSCSYPQSDGFYYKVFPVAEMPTMGAPESVMTFNAFNVTIRSSDPNCTYTLDFDDGVRVALSSNRNEIIKAHYYANAGEYKITLSAHLMCMPRTITASILSNDTTFANASLECPEKAIEVTAQKESCQVQVVRGFGLNATEVSGKFTATLPDTVVETIGLPTPDAITSPTYNLLNATGTYVMPFLSANNDGFLVGIEFHILSEVEVTIQILSPKCPSNNKPCRGGCVTLSDPCPLQTRSQSDMLSDSYSADVVTYSKSDSTYTVSEEIKVKFVNDSKPQYSELPNPVAIKRGDIIAFYVPSTSVVVFAKHDVSYILRYCNQSFGKGDPVPVSNAKMLNQTYPGFRVHVSTPVVLEIPINPKIPSVFFEINVSSLAALDNTILKETVEVQERISGLEILRPAISMYYLELEDITFSFYVSNGTNVSYSVNPGDGSKPKNTSTTSLIHKYKDSGNYTFTVNASNDINSVNTSQKITVVIGIRNLKFVVKPEHRPGEVDEEYNVSFLLEFGVRPIFQINFGNNMSLFMACSDSLVNKTISTNMTYTEVGTYNISVIAHGLVSNNSLGINSTVEIMQKIRNLTVYKKYAEGESIPIKNNTIVEEHYPDQPIILRAQVSSGSPVNYKFLVNEPGKDEVTWNNSSFKSSENPTPGRWKIEIFAENAISIRVSITIIINVVDRCESIIDIYDQRPTRDDPFKTNLGSDIRINTHEELVSTGCQKPKYSCWNFTWTLFNNNGSTTRTVKYTKHKQYFLIKKGAIKQPGLYRVKMVAKCNDSSRTITRREEESYFEVEASDLVANILGGNERDVRISDDEITLDASESYDPDVGLFNSSNLLFNWTCVNCSHVKFDKPNAAKVRITSSSLKPDKSYEVMVTVTTNSGKVANATQLINVKNENYPTTLITCRVNCLPLVNPTDRLSLEGKCSSSSESDKCDNSVNFTWTVSENKTKVEGLFTTTGFKQENLVLEPNVLKRNTKYLVELVATTINGLSSESNYPFKTAGILTGGACIPNPKNGTAALTDFRIECSKWQGGEFPLTYKIQYQSSADEWILWYQGEEQVSPWNKLPAGRNERKYMINITVEIEGKYGGYVKKNYSVKVEPQNNHKQFKKSLQSLESIDGEEEPQKLTQQIIALSQELNNKPATSEQDDEKIRQKFVEKLANSKANDLPLIQQTTEALESATNDSEEVNHETQETGAKKLKEMSETLLNIASNSDKRTGQEIDDTGGKLLTSFAKILSASFFTGQDTTKKDAPKEAKPNLYGTLSKRGNDLTQIGEKTEEVVEEFDESIKHVTAAVVKRKLLGEKPTVLTTPKFEVKLSKGNPDPHDGKIHYNGTKTKVDQTDVTPSISLPIKALPFLNNETDSIYTEVITFDDNPYTWDIKNSHYIQRRVFSFKFRKVKTGEEVNVKNLPEEINIRLPNDEDNIVYTPLNISTDNENFLLFSFQIDESHYDEMIMIDIRNSKPTQKGSVLYVKYGAKVSLTNYDFKHQLSLQCRNCSDFPVDIKQNGKSSIIFIRDVMKVKSVQGVVSVGVLPCPDTKNNAKPECELEDNQFSSFVQTVSCRHWNSSEWKKDGCRVGSRSTPFLSSCHCNHLTAFSAYIVRPNPLNKFSVEDFKRGYVSFVAVTIIFLLYFISLIWAKRADRADVSKVGVCGLADNGPQDRYRYEIAVWTGMRRNAGTRSEVTIILSGEKNDSEPRCLVNPQNPNFARGSLEKFLLTSSKDIGSLYCIRVWHDNSHGSWYLSRVMVTDLQKDERYYFICDRWLAVDEDDGQVERLLPVASDEELADFHHLFYSKTKRGLSDTHLWVSVLNRPPQSIFTRVQRLSCCLCIIMTTMFANAMFYETRSEPTADTTNFIGSYSFTWDQVYIGVVSSLIIVPANVIILHIFRNVRPKARKVRRNSKISMGSINTGYHNGSDASFQTLAKLSDQGPRASIALNTMNAYSPLPSAELKKKRAERLSRWARFKRFIMPSSLPHWFVYIGWIILVVFTLGSATVVVLYGMQFGNGRSLQWLLSIFISIAEDIFVLQPLKVLVFALAFALLVKKPDEGEFESSDDFNDDEVEHVDILESQNTISEKKRVLSSPRLPVRPTEEQLAIMRKARLKERKMLFLIQEITVHLIFTIVIALVTYGHKDHRSVYLYRHIDELSKTTDQISNFPQLWNWSRLVLVPKAFPEKLYNGRYVPSYGFFDDGYNNLISRARMRLLRVKNDSCEVAKEFKKETNACLQDYSIFDQDEGCYRSRWDSIKKGKEKSHWCFQNWKDLDGYPTWGTFTTYSGSGFIKELRPGDDNNQTINELESHQWLDKQARALFVEMTTYNANINLYTSITLLFEFPEFGGIFYFGNIIPMRLKLYVGGFAFFILASEVVFALFILGYFYVALKKFYRQRMAYFKEFWNVLDFAILTTSFAAIGVYAYRIDLTTKLMQRVPDRNGEFVNFQYVTYWNEVLNCIIALVVALTTVKLTKLMRFNLRISLFGKTLQDAKHALAGFSVQFGIVFFAYVMVGVLIFGYNVSQFRSIISAMMALGRVILGKSQFRELFTADPIIGPLYFLSYVMFVCWILVTMFVAILNDSYHDVQDRCFGMSNEYEVVDFILARLRAWSGLGGKLKKNLIPADQRWRRAGIKARAAATLGRQRSYKPSDENITLEKTGDLMEKLEDSVRSLENRVYHLSKDFE